MRFVLPGNLRSVTSAYFRALRCFTQLRLNSSFLAVSYPSATSSLWYFVTFKSSRLLNLHRLEVFKTSSSSLADGASLKVLGLGQSSADGLKSRKFQSELAAEG